LFEVVLTGGEPLLRRDIVYPLAEFLSSNNVDVGLNTNLLLMNETDVQRIKDSGISRVFASLPSADEGLYNAITNTKGFRRAVRGIETLVSAKIPLGVNMVVTKSNKHQVYAVGKFLHEHGIKYFSATPASPCEYMSRELELGRAEVLQVLDDLLKVQSDFNMSVDVVEPIPRCILMGDPTTYEQFFKRDCAAGKTTIAISPSGKVRPCTHISEEYGDLIKEELSVIWKRLSPWRAGEYIPDECNLCGERNICSYGCREAARIDGGEYSSMEPWAIGPVSENRKKLAIPEVPTGVDLRIIPNLRFRKESRGYFVFSPRDHSAIYANDDLFRALIVLNKMKRFRVEEMKKGEKGREWSNIINYLNSRRLIEKW